MIRDEIKKITEKAIKKLYKIEAEVKIDRPQDGAFGDYSTNVAMVIKKNPQEIAAAIKSDLLEKVEVKNGFINFFISKEYLQKQVGEILKQEESFGEVKIGKGQKVDVEFISSNPTGQLHIGNGRGAFLGDCLSNILKTAGYKVTREYYVNDSRNSNQIQELGKTALGKGESYLTPYLKNLILKLKRPLKEIKTETDAGYFLAQNITEDIRKFIENELKIKFDYYISEHNLFRQDRIKKIYEFLKNKNLVYQKDGAFWLKTSKFCQKDDVLIRENGQSTYFLSDIAYHQYKIERGFKKIIDIWGADHQGHVPRTKAAMKILGYKGGFDVLITQLVRLKSGKMSKRKGQIITLEELLNEVGLDVVRFFYLTKSIDTQMEFDLDLAKEQSEKNPVYYIQYAYARICSILNKCGKSPSFAKASEGKQNLKLLNNTAELDLVKQSIRLPEVVEDTAKDYQVQRLPQYATDLATAFHQFYRDCRVINEDGSANNPRLALVLATKIVLENTLKLMGISAPEKM